MLHFIVILYLKYGLEWYARVLQILDLAIPIIMSLKGFSQLSFQQGACAP